jgi:hypothetical protein
VTVARWLSCKVDWHKHRFDQELVAFVTGTSRARSSSSLSRERENTPLCVMLSLSTLSQQNQSLSIKIKINKKEQASKEQKFKNLKNSRMFKYTFSEFFTYLATVDLPKAS